MILCLCPNPSIDMYTWVHDIKPGEANRVLKEQRFPGGKGVHVALAAAELGEEVMLLGFWGGASGQWIKESCQRAGISCLGPEIEGWSRTCLSFKSENKYDDTELLGTGPEINEKNFESFLAAFDKLLPKADCVTMSGSWPKGAPTDAYAQLIRHARQAGKDIFLDCTGPQLSEAIAENPYSIHLNRTESADYFKVDDFQLLSTLLYECCELAIITAGEDGLYYKNKNYHLHAKCAIEKVNSSVGSGDCLVAGLAVAYSRGFSSIDTARLAVACGGANCLRPELGMLHRREVEMLLKKAVVKEL